MAAVCRFPYCLQKPAWRADGGGLSIPVLSTEARMAGGRIRVLRGRRSGRLVRQAPARRCAQASARKAGRLRVPRQPAGHVRAGRHGRRALQREVFAAMTREEAVGWSLLDRAAPVRPAPSRPAASRRVPARAPHPARARSCAARLAQDAAGHCRPGSRGWRCARARSARARGAAPSTAPADPRAAAAQTGTAKRPAQGPGAAAAPRPIWLQSGPRPPRAAPRRSTGGDGRIRR